MKNIYIVIISLLLLYCKPINNANNCTENSQFKEQFFKNVKVVEDFMVNTKVEFRNIDEYESVITEEKIKNFNSSLRFISKYTHVSFESMANYNGSYPIGVYRKDREGWIKWYEENKCNNIQFKQ